MLTAQNGHPLLANPVNWQHPFNRGRLIWLRCMPGWMGGAIWRDICAVGNGTLIDMGNTSNGFRPTMLPGHNGCMLFDGVAGCVSLPSSAIPPTSGPFTVALWIKTTQLNSTNQSNLINNENYGAGSGWTIVDIGPNGTIVSFRINAAVDPGSTNVASVPRSSLNDGKWHRVVGVYTGTQISLYLDGTLGQTQPATTLTPNLAGGYVGTYSLGGNFTGGMMDDVTIFARAWSAADVLTDYILSPQGYPGVLNRQSRAMWVQSSATAVYSLASAQGELTRRICKRQKAPVLRRAPGDVKMGRGCEG